MPVSAARRTTIYERLAKAGWYSCRMRALVTGGTGKLGTAIAARLGREGASVVAAGRAEGDLSRADAAHALVARAADELGGLDLVVHAASSGFVPKPLEDTSEADWDAATPSIRASRS